MRGDVLSYAIIAGNDGAAFAMDPASGVVSTAMTLDHEMLNSYSLIVSVTDGSGLSDQATVSGRSD